MAVIAQLRFDPILKVAAAVPEFQDQVRQRFPRYEEREVRAVDVDLSTGVRVRQAKEHRFAARGEASIVSLGDNSVALEYRDHQHRDVLFSDVTLVCQALVASYQDVSPIRLGLRYVNVVDRDLIAHDIGTAIEWPDLVHSSFLQMPGGLADLVDTRFAHEITSTMVPGSMTLRYGLVANTEGRTVFRLDIDRYREDSFTTGDVDESIKAFADDIFQVFMAAAEARLISWMGEDST